MKVLCVAEKPSIAKSITQILSGGQFNTRASPNQYTKNYDFNYPQTNAFFTVTSVSGHLLDYDFDRQYSNWKSCEPITLFDAPIYSSVKKDSEKIAQNLRNEIRNAQTLMIWTDCDREGENIGAEIVDVCRKVKRNIVVQRARFSAIINQQIHHAAQHPVELDMRQASAVEARILLDLRAGAAFTRLQTLRLQDQYQQLQGGGPISYGPCQFPTLGFVVSRYNLVKNFRPETFYFIYMMYAQPGPSEDQDETVFTWRRGKIFDIDVAASLYVNTLEHSRARVVKVTQKETKKWKPLPLTTVDLQKAASRILKISPKKALDIAEKLYQQGFLSYPRTETDQFDPQFNFHTLIEKQTADTAWGAFATSLTNGGFHTPRQGKRNDKAHPPIHPTAHAGNLAGDERKVYEYITRRFLACCSKDALGMETTVDVEYGGEEFYASGLTVLERNYLEVFPYDKWADKEIPHFNQGQQFTPTVCELREGQTTRPNLLTEADLVTLMDKNGIGTDATIAQHIQMIIDRKYVIERMQGATKYLVPSTLGIGLVEGYDAIGFERSLNKPQLRRETEREMVQICDGLKTKNEMITVNVERFKDMYVQIRTNFARIAQAVGGQLQGNGVDYPPDFLDDMGPGGGGGGGGDGGAGGGGRGRGRGGRGSRGGSSGRATTTRRGGGRGGSRGGAPANRGDDDDSDHQPPPPRPPVSRSRNTASASGQNGTSTTRTTSRAPVSSKSKVEVYCQCGESAGERVVTKDNENKGRKFWTCENRKCQFFEWMDGPSSSNVVIPSKRPFSRAGMDHSGSEGPPRKRRCDCENIAVLREVTKGNSKGKKFWGCANTSKTAQCGFFEWADENEVVDMPVANKSRGGSGPSTGQNGGSSGIVCFKCNEPGHFANGEHLYVFIIITFLIT
ncbi:DNA topoisomerase [Abortiporus biennis]|nr:DNA topoisomerase [Abortiporus biennis]